MGIYSVVSSVASVAEANAQWKAIQRRQSNQLTSAEIVASANELMQRAYARNSLVSTSSRERPSAKCQSCGSHEYVRASAGVICSYCRTPESGISIRSQQTYGLSHGGALLGDDPLMVRYDSLFGSAVLRPDVAVRIKG